MNGTPRRAVLVRIGIDHSFGGWNAPADPTTGEFVYVPIPESESVARFHAGCARRFTEVIPQLESFAERSGLDLDGGMRFPRRQLLKSYMHLDPDFEHLTYGDDGDRRGKVLHRLEEDDLLVFYAGMRSTDLTKKELIYGLVGLLTVDRVCKVHAIPKSDWHQNAHTRKLQKGADDVVVWGKPGVSGRLTRCLPIGEYRDRAYRVRRDLLEVWGGLSVKNGYLQRSGRLPTFLDARAFYYWFRRQNPPLVAANFDMIRRARRPARKRLAGLARANGRKVKTNGDKVVVVHLRQPNRRDRNEMRSDPFYEFGSFGCTKCHHRNLMNPKHIAELQGARLAFAQGGSEGFRLILLTPPVTVVEHEDRCELRWQPPRKPFRYDAAPRFVDRLGRTDFLGFDRLFRRAGRSTAVGQFSSNFRARRKPLPDNLAQCLRDVYERFARDGWRLARTYAETMPVNPPCVDRRRKSTYRRFLAEAGARSESSGCSPRRSSCR